MHASRIVARVLDGVQDLMHASRWRALHDVADAAVSGASLSLTNLALRTTRPTTLRHRVKCVDRLLGNAHLGLERQSLYAALARRWLSGLPQLLIVVDWSSLTADLRWHWLRASVVVEGRSLTLYEEVHPRTHLGNWQVHRRFLERLALILPPSTLPPIVLTDAGFRNPWFRLIAQRGWHWIGRVRNRDFVRQTPQAPWFPAKQLYRRARAQAQDFGAYETVRNNPLGCRLVLIKNPPKGRKRRYPSGKEQRNSEARKISARYREPWLLTCDRTLDHLSAQSIVKLYAPLPAASLGYLASLLGYGAPHLKPLRAGVLKTATERYAHAEVAGQRWFWPADEKPLSRRHATDDAVRLLAPFDPIVWDRRRFELLWGWAYRFEAYTPAAKRLMGHYALPLLWGEDVIGWANVKVLDGRLVPELGFVGSRPRSALFSAGLDDELARMSAFLGLAG